MVLGIDIGSVTGGKFVLNENIAIFKMYFDVTISIIFQLFFILFSVVTSTLGGGGSSIYFQKLVHHLDVSELIYLFCLILFLGLDLGSILGTITGSLGGILLYGHFFIFKMLLISN